MSIVKIINNSTLTDYAAIMRVGSFITGYETYSVQDAHGRIIVKIKIQKSNTYVIVDAN